MSELLEAALWHASHGHPCFPCNPVTKRPITPRGFKDATTDVRAIREWFTDRRVLLAIPTGAASGLVGLDADGDVGADELARLERSHGPLPRTASVKTPNNGQHYYFRHPGVQVRCSVGQIAPSIDVRGDGGYAILPPSVMANGRRYEVDEAAAPALMPGWLLDATTAQPEGKHGPAPVTDWLKIIREGANGPEYQNGRRVKSGARHTSLARLSGYLLRRNVDPQLVREIALLVNEARFRPPTPREDVEELVNAITRLESRRRRGQVG